MKTLLIITPHMSTGGCPQVVAKKVEMLKDYYNVVVVEWECVAWLFVVQRNRVIDMIGDKFITLSQNKREDMVRILNDYKPNYVMIEELSETFMSDDVLDLIYHKDRDFKVFETTHSSYSRPASKKFMPDKFIFVSPYSVEVFKELNVPMDLIEYPINNKTPDKEYNLDKLNLNREYKHIINIGLFTPGKNQAYLFEIAKKLKKYKIMFHFIGNQAGNFIDYWKPLMEDIPENCKIWGERNDVDTFIQACDMHVFTSKLELNPLSIKESLEYGKPTMIFNLHTYKGKYDNTENIHYLSGDVDIDVQNIKNILNLTDNNKREPKIRVVHLLLDPKNPLDIPIEKWNSTIEKQNHSIECWSQLKDKFYDYVPRYSIVNRSELPVENCKDPSIINHSKELINNPPVLTYGHYGAYKAHVDAISENFDNDIDALIITEGDSYTDLSAEEFYKKVIDSYKLSEKIDAKIVSYAGPCYMTGGEWWNMTEEYGDWLKVPHFLLGTAYMIMDTEKENIINNIHNTGWHSPDFWLAWNYHNKENLLTSKLPIFYQKEGYSVLDYQDK